MLGLLVQWNVGILYPFCRDISSKNYIELNKYYAEKFSKTTGTEIKIQPRGGNSIAVEYFPNSLDPGRNDTKS